MGENGILTSSVNNSKAIGDLYDRLLGAERGKIAEKDLTIHKRLRFPPEMQVRGIFDCNDWVRAQISLPAKAHILDAGCGVGGSLFTLMGAGHSGVGITLSGRQVAVAEREAVRLGFADRCRFLQQSYDQPLADKFELILSIEALTHSQNLSTSIQNLSQHLQPGRSVCDYRGYGKISVTGWGVGRYLEAELVFVGSVYGRDVS